MEALICYLNRQDAKDAKYFALKIQRRFSWRPWRLMVFSDIPECDFPVAKSIETATGKSLLWANSKRHWLSGLSMYQLSLANQCRICHSRVRSVHIMAMGYMRYFMANLGYVPIQHAGHPAGFHVDQGAAGTHAD